MALGELCHDSMRWWRRHSGNSLSHSPRDGGKRNCDAPHGGDGIRSSTGATRERHLHSANRMTEFDFTQAHRKEAWLFLETVWQGLEYLCEHVEKEETKRVAESGKNFAYEDFGDQPGDAMLCNYFLWYTTALYNFIGVFNKAFSPSEDLQQEFANVITWRHKVSAHTSWVWPRGDNRATQNMSIMLFPEFNFAGDGHFEVGGMQIGPVTEGPSQTDSPWVIDASCGDWRWGLVRAHERLKEIVSKYASAKCGQSGL